MVLVHSAFYIIRSSFAVVVLFFANVESSIVSSKDVRLIVKCLCSLQMSITQKVKIKPFCK